MRYTTERVENFIQQFRNVCCIIIVCSLKYKTKAVQLRVLQVILYLYCALDTAHKKSVKMRSFTSFSPREELARVDNFYWYDKFVEKMA